jgi:excisionase family DNA binding protein
MGDEMKRMIATLKEAASLKAQLARQEAAIWDMVAGAFRSHLQSLEEPKKALHTVVPERESVRSYTERACLDTKEAARYLGISRGTLYKMRSAGLKHIKIGKLARYRIEDLDAIASRGISLDSISNKQT